MFSDPEKKVFYIIQGARADFSVSNCMRFTYFIGIIITIISNFYLVSTFSNCIKLHQTAWETRVVI